MAPSPVDSRDRVLHLLKTRGPMTTAALARVLEMTAMGARGHLQLLLEDDLVTFAETRGAVGRPKRTWQLTPAAASRFPEGYAELTADLLTTIRSTFGGDGLERLIAARTAIQLERYRARLPAADAPLTQRVRGLARLRTDEGYMARVERRRDGSLLLIENHCPICAAVAVCQGLCASELDLFRAALGADTTVDRTEHMVDGARRCVYRIAPK